ncbi:unnamed protein product, partial [Dibothriocephalus latus]
MSGRRHGRISHGQQREPPLYSGDGTESASETAGKPPTGLHLDVMKEGKLVQVPIDSGIHFGASTRLYIIRERPAPLYSLNTTDPAG